MAKAKGKRVGRPPAEEEPVRATVISLKGSPEYVEWLDAAHRKTHIPKAQIFRLAVQDWAAKQGLPVPPEI